ncbi:hypothetical protein SASPL_108138 [Salvia splendens]|uniref:Sulfite exporter TauE/SafE n=1 Tax=Salvia splendens TaxID=180675 RepID=A0A8X9A5Y1_SALSN|nr:hypothetical protein SASPL_108138 [Salvia splendens]
MAEIGAGCNKGLSGKALIFIALLAFVCGIVSAQENLEQVITTKGNGAFESDYSTRIIRFLKQSRELLARTVWPDIEFGWRIVLGTVVGFFGAALASVGGVGGGGIFVPMLSLIIWFNPKTSTAISKCMITGAAFATVSIQWMVTVLLIVLFIATSTKAFFKGVETWKKETIIKKEAARWFTSDSQANGSEEAPYKLLPTGPADENRVSAINNVSWKKLGFLLAVWLVIFLLHVSRDFMNTCSVAFWSLTLLQIPVTIGASGIRLSVYTIVGACWRSRWFAWLRRRIHLRPVVPRARSSTTGFECHSNTGHGILRVHVCHTILPLEAFPSILRYALPHLQSRETSLQMIPIMDSSFVLKSSVFLAALYFVVVAPFAALIGLHVVRKIVSILGRASLIIFILAFTIFVSAISPGWVGIENIIGNVDGGYEMWFYSFCEYNKS